MLIFYPSFCFFRKCHKGYFPCYKCGDSCLSADQSQVKRYIKHMLAEHGLVRGATCYHCGHASRMKGK